MSLNYCILEILLYLSISEHEVHNDLVRYSLPRSVYLSIILSSSDVNRLSDLLLPISEYYIDYNRVRSIN
jgi:hypothetical protein